MGHVYIFFVHMHAHIQVDPQSPVPAYRQIIDQLRAVLVEEELVAGEKLPPVRRLALGLGVHFNTVAEAYRTLEQEGFLRIEHGKGAVVASRHEVASGETIQQEELKTLRQRLRELVAERRASGLSVGQIALEMRGMLEALEA